MNQKKQKDINQILWNLIGNFSYAICIWLLSWILSKASGRGSYEDIGILALAASISNVISVLSNYGMRAYQVSDLSRQFGDEDYIASRLCTVFLGAAVCLLFSLCMGYSVKQILCINLYMTYQSFCAYSDVLWGIQQKQGELHKVGKSMTLHGVAGLVTFILLISFNKKLITAMIGWAVSTALITLCFDVPQTRRVYHGSFVPHSIWSKKVRQLLLISSPMLLYSILTPLMLSIPRLILEKYGGSQALGIFSLTFAPTVIISTFAVGILMPFLPKMAKHYAKNEKNALAKTFLIPFSLLSVCGIAAVCVSDWLGEWGLAVVYDSEIAQYKNLLIAAMIVSSLSALLSCTGNMLITTRKMSYLIGFNVLGCALIILFSALWIPKQSMIGASHAMIAGMGIQLVVTLIYLVVFFNTNTGWHAQNNRE